MSTPSRPIALITGASSGIGKEFALALSKTPYREQLDLVLVSSQEDKLEAAAAEIRSTNTLPVGSDITIQTFAADLTNPDERVRLLEFLGSQTPVELLINNAGYGSFGDFCDTNPETEVRMIALNCQAPVHLTRMILPRMIDRGHGTIVNVCSTAAFQPLPYMATYGATKAFLLNFSLALAAEVKRSTSKTSKVTVLALCPGPTSTAFHLVSGLPEKLTYLPAMSSHRVVAQALRGIERRRWVVINGLVNALLARVARTVPPEIASRLVAQILGRDAARIKRERARKA